MKRVLVANRGEIAVRIIRACREAGLEAVAVHSQADRDALHVRMADQAVAIGPSRPGESYLRAEVLVQVALATRCDAVHPGYGFLSENGHFAALCGKNGLTFIGPKPEMIAALGDKVRARRIAVAAGVPVVDGTQGEDIGFEDIEAMASRSGFPLLLKAAAGGGGRGMRVVQRQADLRSQFEEARAEAASAFGDGTIYAERFLPKVRHVEVQIVGDHHGGVVHFGTRDCTLQRRHQKIIEEAPAICLSEEARDAIAADAVRVASQIGYVGAGTVEFVVDVETGKHYFIEVNARIQVEHPVTEMVAGVDLIREQIRVADGANRLSRKQSDIAGSGHAIELRINAEDPARGFAPSPGRITALTLPGGPGVRVDTHCYAGYMISPFYDSMIAKLIVHDEDRGKALVRARRALSELRIEGITSNIGFLLELLRHPDVIDNRINTTWLEGSAIAKPQTSAPSPKE